jgi:sec-independent protein translocase protein TatA
MLRSLPREETRMMPLALLGPIGLPELLILLVIVIFLFGARRIPEIARGMGEGIRGFRSSLRGGDEPSDEGKIDGETTKTPGD